MCNKVIKVEAAPFGTTRCILPGEIIVKILAYVGDYGLAVLGGNTLRAYCRMYDADPIWCYYYGQKRSRLHLLHYKKPEKFCIYEVTSIFDEHLLCDYTGLDTEELLPVHVYQKVESDQRNQSLITHGPSIDGLYVNILVRTDEDYMWPWDMTTFRFPFKIPHPNCFMPTYEYYLQLVRAGLVRGLCSTIVNRRKLVFALKFYFVYKVINQVELMGVHALDYARLLSDDITKRDVMKECLDILVEVGPAVSEVIIHLWNWYTFVAQVTIYHLFTFVRNPYVVLLICFCVSAYGVRRIVGSIRNYLTPFTCELKNTCADSPVSRNYFVKSEVVKDEIVYHCMVNGKEYSLKEGNVKNVEEMAMPGSILVPSIKRPVGAIIVASDEVEACLFGLFWRYGDYLITAKHVAARLWDTPAYVFLKVGTPNKRDVIQLESRNMIRVDTNLFDLDNNKFSCDTLDVFAVKLDPKLWSRIGLTAARVNKSSMFDLTVSSVGYVNWTLMSGCGKTVPGGSKCEIKHTASTNKGFSGGPLFNGRDVIGMHIMGSDDANTAVRIESILYFLPDESETPSEFAFKQELKRRDMGFEVDTEHGVYVGMSKRGRTAILTEQELLELGFDITDKIYRDELPDVNYKDDYSDYSDDDYYSHRSKRNRKENGVIRRIRGKRVKRVTGVKAPLCDTTKEVCNSENIVICESNEIVPKPCKYTAKAETSVWLQLGGERPVHCAGVPEENPFVRQFVESNADLLTKVCYEPGEFSWPVITAEAEEKSLLKHMELFHKNVGKISSYPIEAELTHAAFLSSSMMANNKFVIKENYKDKETILKLIHSNRVDGSRSAGQPYQSEGMPTIADVIKNIGPEGLSEKVLSEWNNEFFVKIFLKSEPHKKKKIDSGMLRIIKCFPVHKMIKHQLILRPAMDALVSEWRKSPIKYAFSPNKPGHCEHLASVFKGHEKIVDMDKSNWDYSMFAYFFVALEKIFLNLAVRDSSCPEARFNEWKVDLHSVFEEILKDVRNYCSNGNVFLAKDVGTMLSGFFGTIGFNSIAQLVLHILIMKRLELPDEDILDMSKNPIIAGGDDTKQAFEDMTLVPKYLLEASKLGFDMEHEVTPFNGSEFFSTKLVCENGIVQPVPIRITKHVENLLRVKTDKLSGALASHMINYCWNHKMYEMLEKLYRKGMVEHPDLFPEKLLWNKRWLQYKCKGLESGDLADEAYAEFVETLAN